MFRKKFDYLFTENKMMNYALEQTKETLSILNSEERIIQGREEATISKALSKKIKRDLTVGVKQGVKFVSKQRKKLIKAGIIDIDEERVRFLYNMGVYLPPENDGNSDDQEPATPEKEPSEPEEPAQEGESEDKPESSTEETAKVQPETGDKGGETFLSAKEEKAEKTTAKIETEK